MDRIDLPGAERAWHKRTPVPPTATTGRPLTATSIQVLRIRDGHIVLFRDFAGPRLLEEVTGNRVRKAEADPDVAWPGPRPDAGS